MTLSKPIAALVLVASIATPVGAAEEKSRAELFRDWRAGLGAALRAHEDGDDARAIELYGSILAEAEARGEDGMLVARALDGLADLYRDRHRFDLAAPLYERSVASWTRLLGEAQPRRAVSLHNLGICYVEQGEWAAAERVLTAALAVWRGAERYKDRIDETETVLDAARARRTIPWDSVER